MIFGKVPQGVRVFDNKDATHDRYAVLMPDGACFTMNGFPFNEDTGFCQYDGQGYQPNSQDVERDRVPTQVVAKIHHLMA